MSCRSRSATVRQTFVLQPWPLFGIGPYRRQRALTRQPSREASPRVVTTMGTE